MGEIDLVAELKKDNPSMREIDLRVFADALRTYNEASENVTKNGAICQHPRTGAPIENPYLKVQASAGATLSKMRAIRSDRVCDLLQGKPAPQANKKAPRGRVPGGERQQGERED